MAMKDRGFASMDRRKQKQIASLGGKAAHKKGVAHEWSSEEARNAGRKGGLESARRKALKQTQTTTQTAPTAAPSINIGSLING